MTDLEIKARAKELLARMTPEEKVSQMTHDAKAVERLGVPAYNWWNEALHGVARAGTATVFPQALALAATFDDGLTRRVADAVSTEGRAKFNMQRAEGDLDIYKGITFWAPNINLFRDPRWGRGHETYGEDPYLTARMGLAFIGGLQGPDRDSLKSAACAKHFAVHSGPEDRRHRFNAVVEPYDLWNSYLAAFETAVVDGHVEIVMGAYNRTLGRPCCGSPFLLKDILRDKWGFDGHVVSDCWAIKDFHEAHHVTATPVESVALAIKSGCDINCGVLFSLAYDAVQNGLLDEADIDAAVTRLLVTRLRLGLLGAPENARYAAISYDEVDSPAHRALNLEAARRGVVLLKNDGRLPFDAAALASIAVIGPNADSRRALDGNYQGTPSARVTVLEGVRAIAEPAGARVFYSEGCALTKDRCQSLAAADDRLAEARACAKRADASVVVLGLDGSIEGEEGDAYSESWAGDRPDIELPGRQEALLRAVVEAAGGKPVVAVVISGGAMAGPWAAEHVSGLFHAFYPGALGGQAVAEAIFGVTNPSGKLPVTFYRSTRDLPDFTDYAMNNRTYRYFSGEPLYPFGFGLSYGRFELEGARFDGEAVSVSAANMSERPGRNVVQIYAEMPAARERRCLCGFQSVFLGARETKTLRIPLDKNAFSRYDERGTMRPVPGPRRLTVGWTADDPRSVALYGQKPLEIRLPG